MFRKFNETLGDERNRVRTKGPREPLRTLGELAAELGCSVNVLGKLLKEPGAPSPRLDYTKSSAVVKTKWYSPSEVRAWWNSRDQGRE